MRFLDLTGYTRLTEERGDEAAADLATQAGHPGPAVRPGARGDAGEVARRRRDVLLPGAGTAVLAAVEMVEVVGSQGLPPAHVGIHAGPVVFQEDDYFGRTVNLAARIADYARPDEVLVSQEVVDAADAAPVSFVEIGPVELKGSQGRFCSTPPAAPPEVHGPGRPALGPGGRWPPWHAARPQGASGCPGVVWWVRELLRALLKRERRSATPGLRPLAQRASGARAPTPALPAWDGPASGPRGGSLDLPPRPKEEFGSSAFPGRRLEPEVLLGDGAVAPFRYGHHPAAAFELPDSPV